MNTLQLNWKRIIWQSLTEGFQMTSLPPGWCLKTMKRQPCWCPRPVLWELNFEGFFFSNKFVQLMLAAWVKSLYSTVATEIRKCLFARYLRIKSQLFKNSVQSSTLMCSTVTANRQPGQTVILAKPVKKLENSWLKPRLILQKAKTVLWFTPLSPRKIAW